MIYNHGKLIVLEGSDGSGKATQARLLAKSLEEYGPVHTFEFPRYKQSAFGELIGRCLAGEFGDFLKLSPYLSSLPYMLDRARAKYLLLESLKEGHVICDRYTPSNIVFQSAKLPKNERAAFVSFDEEAEYHELGLPRPDLVIYLSVPTEIATKLVEKKDVREHLGKKKGVKDQHEKNLEFQEEVRKIYQEFSRTRKEWKIVECCEKGELLSREDIHHKVMMLVKSFLKLK
jgi:dTMP kinase